MATDVDVQYFSHLNGLTLGNNWGDLIRLLDKALVTGIDFTQITAASIDEQGDVHITLYAAHNAMLFQVVELTGFAPASFNQKYRIKGVPNTTQLILKPHTAIAETSITTVGAGRLASLGYEIIFRDANDVKRVYRAKNPTSQHPFIRVDESLTSPDGTTGLYTSTYAKSAMVGLLEHMEHIDDFNNPDVLQLPFSSADPARNWKINGTGTGVFRGWSKWYWARSGSALTANNIADSASPLAGDRQFTIIGDTDCFYFLRALTPDNASKTMSGCGIYDSNLDTSVIPSWFFMGIFADIAASTAMRPDNFHGSFPFTHTALAQGTIVIPKYNVVNRISNHVNASGVLPDTSSGFSEIYNASATAALEIPIYDADKFLRGTMKYINYAGTNLKNTSQTTPIPSGGAMYVAERVLGIGGNCGFYFYLGEIE